MNLWVKKSIELARKPWYLDRLHEVYPMEVTAFREISQATLERIKVTIRAKDRKGLIKLLITEKEIKLFPIKDSYIAYLRKSKTALENNPKTIKRIGDRLIKMGYEEVVKMSIQPKETNRRIGPLFRKWLPRLGYPILNQEDFLKYKGICFLEGTDKSLMDFSNTHLGTRLKKGLDLVLKVDNTFVIGEAKFLTDFGGHQNAQFNDPYSLIKAGGKKILRIAVLDGVIWIPTNNQMHVRIKKGKAVAMSALLLDEFIKSF